MISTVYLLYYTVRIAVDYEIRYYSLVNDIWICTMIGVCWISHRGYSFIDRVSCTYSTAQSVALHMCAQVVWTYCSKLS